MKKIFLVLGVSAVMFSTTACGSKTAANSEDAALNDSVSTLFGKVVGAQISESFGRNPEEKLDKNSFIRGIQTAVMADTADTSYLQGLSMGTRFAQQFQYFYQQLGVDVDRDRFMSEFKKAFLADSVGEVMMDQQILNSIMERAQQRAEQRKLDELNNAPEAIANRKAGAAYIDSLKKADPAVKTTASGLAYKVINAGAGDSIHEKDQVAVIYKGTLTDGTVFDDSKGETRTFSPRNVVPGFSEGLKMMKKGAKYMLYIPGDLAYGVKGQPYAKIGPNQTLIFEVEVADVTPIK